MLATRARMAAAGGDTDQPYILLDTASSRINFGNDASLENLPAGDFTAEFWLNLQSRYELELQEDILADRLENEVRAFRFAV